MGRSFYRSMVANGSLIGGIYLGIKAADSLMWNPEKYDAMKEEIELDYWKKYGKPTVIEPDIWKSSINDGEFYQTWLKSKNRKEYLEEKTYKLG